MKCQQKRLSESHVTFVPCENEATTICWCPTWVNIDQAEAGKLAFGPRPNTTINRLPAKVIHLCEEHADNFRETSNPNAAKGTFYWDEEALKQQRLAVERYEKGENKV